MIFEPLKWSILLTIRRPSKNKAVAEKADPRVLRNVVTINGSWPPNEKLPMTPATVSSKIGLVNTPFRTFREKTNAQATVTSVVSRKPKLTNFRQEEKKS